MKKISINKRDLVQAVAYRTHISAQDGEWSWQVTFDPRAQDPQARVVLVNPDVDTEVPYVYLDEDNFDPMAFVDLDDGFRWGESASSDSAESGRKAMEQVRIPKEIRNQIESSLRKQVEYNGVTYTATYY
jgi:hypothetical protein